MRFMRSWIVTISRNGSHRTMAIFILLLPPDASCGVGFQSVFDRVLGVHHVALSMSLPFRSGLPGSRGRRLVEALRELVARPVQRVEGRAGGGPVVPLRPPAPRGAR